MNKFLHLGRMASSYFLRRTTLSHPPYMFSIEATNVCNFKCRFCPQSSPEHQKLREKGFLHVKGFRTFIEKIIETGAANKNISITLDGEPTLNKSLPDFIRVANEYGLYPRFSSNAYVLTPDLTDKLIAAGNFLVSIDFASDAGYFDEVRGPDGAFKRVFSNILYLIERARNPVWKKLTIEIVDVSSFSGAERSSSLKAMNGLLKNSGANPGTGLPPNVKTWSRVFHNFCGHLPASRLPGQGASYVVCPYPWSQFVSTWKGEVVACCRDTAARTVLGNVCEKPIMEIWNDRPYRELRRAIAEKRPQDVAVCSKCDMPYSGGSQRWNPIYLIKSLLRR